MTHQNLQPKLLGVVRLVLTLVIALSLQMLLAKDTYATENHQQLVVRGLAKNEAPPPGAADTLRPAQAVPAQTAPQQKQSLAGKVIMIDAGHGGRMSGAVRSKVLEKNLTLAIALKLKTQLEGLGATVVMTRIDDSDISLQDRVDLSNSVKPDIFVSIHINANTSSSINGIETYYYSPESKRLAQLAYDSLTTELKEPGNWVSWEELFVLHHNDRVSILAEVGYMSHASTRVKLVKDAYQDQIADALCHGIVRYFDELAQAGGAAGSQQPNTAGAAQEQEKQPQEK